ncbi:hypothetical protein AVEN_189579-1 [Araneus ventricosus]|uniref:Uncharacterized protein n=1 Tax=Araneus ventricosus TaxID=182803 RepID=A0A4Y2NQZ7_ARAVE|nr:hypothetical protein AVEN_189579-1 [Araneus ventricosus]
MFCDSLTSISQRSLLDLHLLIYSLLIFPARARSLRVRKQNIKTLQVSLSAVCLHQVIRDFFSPSATLKHARLLNRFRSFPPETRHSSCPARTPGAGEKYFSFVFRHLPKTCFLFITKSLQKGWDAGEVHVRALMQRPTRNFLMQVRSEEKKTCLSSRECVKLRVDKETCYDFSKFIER